YHCEELGGTGGSVGIYVSGLVRGDPRDQLFVLGTERVRPCGIRGTPTEIGSAVHGTVFGVELVRKLLEHDVAAVAGVRRAAPDSVPREHDGPADPGLAEAHLVALDDEVAELLAGVLDDVRTWIDEDRREIRVVAGLSVQEEQAGLRRYGEPDFVRHR